MQLETQGGAALAVEVRDLHKEFRIPGHRPDTLKERAVHPFRRVRDGALRVLDGISFDVHQGEFFGVVGRNGSGKSTLLKLLASIYRADAGTIRIAGNLAPVIELGVGFKADLAARDNIILNGIMMGLTEAEAEARFEPVIEFAELQDFVDLKLKNYSSGMRVRLAFATMIQADADIMLLDEVLAVGDLPFQQKCEEVFQDLRADGRKTLILVSNQVAKVQRYCDRAILIEEGKVVRAGQPDDVVEAYRRVIGQESRFRAHGPIREMPKKARLEQLRVGSGANGKHPEFDQNEEIQARVFAVAQEMVQRPGLRVQIRDDFNTVIFNAMSREISDIDGMLPEQEVSIETVIENRLAPGRYSVLCSLTDHAGGKPAAVSSVAMAEFTVRKGRTPTLGLISLDHEVRAGPPRGEVAQVKDGAGDPGSGNR